MRKIKKAEKPSPKKKSNADYTIINWAQCDKCKQWRQIKRAITKSEDFNCAKVNKSCFKREKPKRKFKLRKNR